jgi:hypothetical protein
MNFEELKNPVEKRTIVVGQHRSIPKLKVPNRSANYTNDQATAVESSDKGIKIHYELHGKGPNKLLLVGGTIALFYIYDHSIKKDQTRLNINLQSLGYYFKVFTADRFVSNFGI